MPRVGFTMKLFKGKEEEYKRRHDAIWPELVSLLKEHGIKEYSIFLDEKTNILFGVLEIDDPATLQKIFYRAVQACGWHKNIWMQCLGPARIGFMAAANDEQNEDEIVVDSCQKFVSIAESKGLMLRDTR